MKKEIKLKQFKKSKNIAMLFLLALTLSCCNNDDDNNQPTNPIDQLPPATQTGANTFGCLLDGHAFLPGRGGNPLDCVYQFVNGEWYFALQANREDENFNLIGLSLSTNALELEENVVYNLLENESGNVSGGYYYISINSFTSQNYTGELTITKLDMQNQIVSGTFWYDIEDQDGIVHEIREGRFDMQFTL